MTLCEHKTRETFSEYEEETQGGFTKLEEETQEALSELEEETQEAFSEHEQEQQGKRGGSGPCIGDEKFGGTGLTRAA